MARLHRSGRAREEGAKPRPLIIRVSDDETRVSILRNAHKLARFDKTRSVYISPDLTRQQQEEDRKNETKLREEATRKTEEKNGGRTRRWIVVGGRGSRRVIDVAGRVPQNQ